jgi:hypothetical protein
MSSFATLLKLALCAILILNGSVSAMASTRMAATHAMDAGMNRANHAAAMSAAKPADEPPCHQAANKTSTSHVSEPVAAGAHSPDEHKQKSSECCQSDRCCGCMHVGQAVAISLSPAANRPAQSRPTVLSQSSHASPALPHLIRPPIG